MKNLLFFLMGCIIYLPQIKAQFLPIGPVGSATYNANSSKANGTGQIHCIAFHPNFPTTNLLFAGSPYGGLWKSTDGGSTWAVVDAVQHLETNSVNDVVISHVGGVTTIYIATGSSNKHFPFIPSCGIYKSTDLGATFAPVGTFNAQSGGFSFSKQKLTTKIAVNPANANNIFVASSDGLYKTTDGGTTWQIVLTETEPVANFSTLWNDSETPGIWSVAFSPNNTNVIYASGLNMYKSTSSGNSGTFSTLTNSIFDGHFNSGASGFPASSTLLQRNMNFKVFNNAGTDNLYVTAFGKYSDITNPYYGVYYHNGSTFTEKYSCNGCGDIITPDRIKLDRSPTQPQNLIVGVTTTMISTATTSTSWSTVTNYNSNAHADIHEITFEPGGTFCLIGTDGGIYKYVLATQVVSELNTGLSVSTIIDMSTSPKRKGYVAIGKQDTNYDWYDGSVWKQDGTGGDGYAPAWFDLTDPAKFFMSLNGGIYEKDMDNNTNTSVNIGCPNTLQQIYQHPSSLLSTRFLALEGNGSKKLHYSNNASHSRNYDYLDQIADPGTHSIRNFTVPKSDPDVLYATTNVFGFWNNAKIMKYNINQYNLSAYDLNCTNSIPCLGGCSSELIYLSSCQNFYPASSVTVSSSNKNKLWASIAYDDRMLATTQYGSNCAAHNNYRYRIMKSTNAGLNWSSDDAGLPSYPITQVLYVDGSNDALFCATANGRVYYKNANLTQWQEVDPNLPRTAITKLEVNYCTRRLYISTYGRGVFYLDLNTYSPHSAQSLEVTGNTVWSSAYYDIGSNIVVKAGSTLTINGTGSATVVNMCKDCSIIVEATGKLIVNNATITNSCGEMWKGIQVWGNTTKRQVKIDSLSSFTGDQGVCLISNSNIEYMTNGINMARDMGGWYEPNYYGGQLVATYSNFRNNINSVVYAPYTPPSDPANPNGYSKTKIMNCTFDNTTVYVYHHIGMWGVRGVSIEGNTFDNHTSYTSYPISNRGRGILALDAEIVALTSTGSTNPLPNTFNNLTWGINIQVSSSLYYYNWIGSKINGAVFNGNKYGLYIKGAVFARITQNTFNVPGLDACFMSGGGDCKSYGLYEEGCALYKIQDNTFNATGTYNPIYKTYGIVANNTTAINESIRRNTTNNFRYALTAVGQNSDQATSGTNGLTFQCNILNNSRSYDIWVAENVVGSVTTNGSIKLTQGSCTKTTTPANNQFNQLNSTTPTLQLARNQLTFGYTYVPAAPALPYTPARVQTNYPITVAAACFGSASPYTTICPSQLDPTDYQPAMLKTKVEQVNFIGKTIDDAQTSLLKVNVANASPYTIEQVYDDLLAKSALSEDVLLSAIENPSAEYSLEKLKALIIKNSGLSKKLINKLLERKLPFTATEIAEIENAQKKVSPENEIKANIAALELQIEEQMLAWSEKYMERGKKDSALLMLKLYENSSTLTHLATVALAWGYTDEAKAAALKLKNQNLADYIDIVSRMNATGRNWKTVSPDVVQSLWWIYNKGGIASVYAQSALAIAADTLIKPYLPDEETGGFSNENMLADVWQQMKAISKGKFTANPNPADESVVVSYAVDNISQMAIEIIDVNGKLIESRVANGNQEHITFNTSAWQSGIYLVKGLDNKHQPYFAKVNIRH